MNVLEFSLVVWGGSLVAGFLGALTGLGGGVVLVPMLTVLLGVDIRYAIGASLVSVIATSSGAAAAYVKEGFSNIRIGMFLEIATTLGALAGATLATHVPSAAIATVFGCVLIASAYVSRKPRSKEEREAPPDPLATKLRLNGSFPEAGAIREYNVQHVPAGLGTDVCRWGIVRIARHRLWRYEGSRHGSGDEDSFQSVDHHQQFHDRGYRRSQRWNLFRPRIYRSRSIYAGDAGRSGRLVSRNSRSCESGNEVAAAGIRSGNRSSGNRNALQRPLGEDLK